jgi:hypothetical protein
VICMPSPESPAKRITARSMRSGVTRDNGVSKTVDMDGGTPIPNLHYAR